jgi:hypothetical protein
LRDPEFAGRIGPALGQPALAARPDPRLVIVVSDYVKEDDGPGVLMVDRATIHGTSLARWREAPSGRYAPPAADVRRDVARRKARCV